MASRNRHLNAVIIFILLISLLTALFSWLFYPRNNRADNATDAISGNKLLGEPPNTIDVLIIGDSQAYETISPLEIWQEAGITSYISGTGGQPICEMPDFVRAAFKNHQLKVVVLEADTAYASCSLSKYAYTKLKGIIPLLQYHDRWKTIGTDKFTFRKDYTETDPLKGFVYSNAEEPYAEAFPDYMGSVGDYDSVGRAAILSIAEIKKLCDANGAELLILSVPNLDWSYGRHNCIQSIAEKYGVEYLDMNTVTDFSPIDWTVEAKDYGVHVNYSGAVRVSQYISQMLENRGDIVDHRESTEFALWNSQLEDYRLITGPSHLILHTS